MGDDINASPNRGAGLNEHDKNDQENDERKQLQDNKSTLTTSIMTPVGYQISALAVAQHTVRTLKDSEESTTPSHQLSQGPQHLNMCILESARKPAQDKISITPGANGRDFTEATAITREALATDLTGDIMAESTGKVKSPNVECTDSGGVTKETANRSLNGQSAAKVTAKTEEGMTRKNMNSRKEVMKDAQNIAASTTANKIRRTRHKITPGEILNGTERHQRILLWIEQCTQSELFLHPTMGKTPPPSPIIHAIQTAGESSTGRNPAKPAPKPTRPIRESKAGAGITKKSPPGRLTGQSAAKSKAKGKVEVGEGRSGVTGVSPTANLSKVPNNPIASLTAVKTVSTILKPKDGAGVTKKIIKRDSPCQVVENATTNCPKPRGPKRKDREGGKKKTAAAKIWEENKVLMLDLEMLKRVDAELDRQLALCRGMIQSEDTSTISKSPSREPNTDTILSHGLLVTESKDAIEERGMERGIFQAGNNGQVFSFEADGL